MPSSSHKIQVANFLLAGTYKRGWERKESGVGRVREDRILPSQVDIISLLTNSNSMMKVIFQKKKKEVTFALIEYHEDLDVNKDNLF